MSNRITPHFEMISLAMQGKVAVITLNRPERLNAAPPQMFEEIAAALQELPKLGARALLITGAGRAFCSGADLQARADTPGETRGERSHKVLTQSYGPTMVALSKLKIPIVSAVNGAAAGIGCSLALAADFVIAARSAFFLQAFVNVGLVPDGGASWTLPRLVGRARATEMMLLGERISADKAESWGLIYRAVDDADLPAEAIALAMRLAAGPTVALGLARHGIVQALNQTYEEALASEAKSQTVAANSADSREGGLAFLERRKAEFKGA